MENTFITDEKLIQELASLRQKIAEMEKAESINIHPENLRQGSENFFYLITENVPALIAYVDAEDLRYRFVNKHYEEFFEQPRETIIGKQVREIIGEENYRFALPYIESALSGKVTSCENICVTPRGKSWLKVNYAPDVDKLGAVKGIFVLNVDITEYKQAEAAIGKYSDDLKERVKELNCLYSISEIVRRNDIPRGKIFQECASMLSRAYLFPEITVCRITWGDREYGTKNFRKTKWLQNHAIMVHGERAGTIEVCYLEERQEEYEGPFLAEERQLLNSVADLLGRSEERKQAEEALRESRQQFQGLVETLYDWVWELNSRARYTYVSPQIKHILGYDREEILGKTPYDLMSPEDAKRVSGIVRALIKERKPMVALENIYIHKDGHPVVLETNGLPFYDAAGKLIGYRGTDCDITARKQAEEEREKLISELREALARVRALSGMLPICSSCKKIRDDKGYWEQIEVYIRDHSEAEFSHGICPECAERLYPGLYKKK